MIWQKVDPNGLNDLLTLNRSMGLWVHFVTNPTANIDSGYKTTQALSLIGGVDNYVSYLHAVNGAPTDLATQLSGAPAYVISTTDPATGQFLTYDSHTGGIRTLTMLKPGYAYIVHPDSSTTWTVKNLS
jgi:hypothetical protein